MRNDISFDKDIIKEVQEELDIDYNVVKSVYDHFWSYLKHLLLNSSYCTIKIRHLGFIYSNYYSLYKKAKRAKKDKFIVDRLKALDDLRELDKEIGRKTITYRRNIFNTYFFTSGQSLIDLEQEQEEYFNK